MPLQPNGERPFDPDPSHKPDDGFLIAGMLGGDSAALRELMNRYDRLVRYTIFRQARDRCTRDPQWLDSIASESWSGFVRSMQRAGEQPPKSAAAYLARLARNRTISAMRQLPAESDPAVVEAGDDLESMSVSLDDPLSELTRIEDLDTLQSCLSELDDRSRALTGQLEAITDRRWREAAEALGLKESTLRSRWKSVVERLSRCLERKTGKQFAPGDDRSDL